MTGIEKLLTKHKQETHIGFDVSAREFLNILLFIHGSAVTDRYDEIIVMVFTISMMTMQRLD